MKLQRSVDIQIELQSSVVACVSAARCFHSTHAQLLESYHSLFARYPKDLSRPVREYIRGYFTALIDSLYRHDLVYGHELDGLFFFQKWEELPSPVQEAIKQNKTDASGHFWKDTINKPASEVRPFFTHPLNYKKEQA